MPMTKENTTIGFIMGACGSIVYAKKAGLDPKTVLESICGESAVSWSLTNLGPRMVLALAKNLYDRLAAEGGAENGTQALYRRYDQNVPTVVT